MRSATDLDLLQDYLDDRLAPEAAADLEARLKAEPSLAEALVRLAREEAIYAEWARSAAVASIEIARPRRRRLAVAGLVSVAALLAALLAGPWFASSPRPLAVLDEVQGEVYVVTDGARAPARPGLGLRPGTRLTTEGDGSSATVTYEGATRLELGADTTVRLPEGRDARQALRRLILEEGLLTGDAVRAAEGLPLVVSTPHAEAVVQGKHFSLASTSGATLVELEDGRGKLTRKSDGQSIELLTGFSVLTLARAEPLKAKPLASRARKPRLVLTEGSGPVLSLTWTPDGRGLVSGGWDGTITFWDASTGAVRRTLRGSSRPIRGLALTPDRASLLTGSDERNANLRLWDLSEGEERLLFRGHRGVIHAVAISPDGQTIASGGSGGREGGEVRLWEAMTARERGVLRGHTGDVTALAFTPDGRRLASAAARDQAAHLWDVVERRELARLPGPGKPFSSVALSPDGQLLATGCRDGSVSLWDVATGEEKGFLLGDAREVRSVDFAPDGRTLAATNGPLVRLWDLTTRQERLCFKAHNGAISVVRFSPDGLTLATASHDRTVKVWDALDR